MENSATKPTLTDKQRARIECNRQRAVLLRNARLAKHPYASKSSNNKERSEALSGGTCSSRTLDTGGGFLLDIDEQIEAEKELNVVFEPGVNQSYYYPMHSSYEIIDLYIFLWNVYYVGPDLGGEQIKCIECGKSFLESFLHKNFSVKVCDGCR